MNNELMIYFLLCLAPWRPMLENWGLSGEKNGRLIATKSETHQKMVHEKKPKKNFPKKNLLEYKKNDPLWKRTLQKKTDLITLLNYTVDD